MGSALTTPIKVAQELIKTRAHRIPAWEIAFLLDNQNFRVAGGCFMDDTPNDYDVYPAFGVTFDHDKIRRNLKSLNGEVLFKSKNALTVRVHGKVIQFCRFYKTTLAELVDSFDFSHCQVGVEYQARYTPEDGYASPKLNSMEWTDDWMRFRINGQSTYTGSEYPLSSLIRMNKYVKRGIIKGKSYTVEALKILRDIIGRGYVDYPDFKDQLDAVDLLLLEPTESNAAWQLFLTCQGRGLTTKFYTPDELEALKHEDELTEVQ